MDPGHACVRRNGSVWLVEVSINGGVARYCNSGGPIREVVGVLGADDVDFGESCGRCINGRFPVFYTFRACLCLAL